MQGSKACSQSRSKNSTTGSLICLRINVYNSNLKYIVADFFRKCLVLILLSLGIPTFFLSWSHVRTTILKFWWLNHYCQVHFITFKKQKRKKRRKIQTEFHVMFDHTLLWLVHMSSLQDSFTAKKEEANIDI